MDILGIGLLIFFVVVTVVVSVSTERKVMLKRIEVLEAEQEYYKTTVDYLNRLMSDDDDSN